MKLCSRDALCPKIVPDCLIFDVDGVLVAAGESFPEMIRITVEREWARAGFVADAPGYSTERNEVLKRHGAFNDDYDIVWVLLNISAAKGRERLSEALPAPEELAGIISDCASDAVEWTRRRFAETFERARIREVCSKVYLGDSEERGTCALETSLLSAEWANWRDLPLPAYIYTGRNLREWRLARELLGWSDFPHERVVHSDSGMQKPSASGLSHLCDRFGHTSPLFIGDTASDLQAYLAFGAGWFAAVGGLLPDVALHFSDVNEALNELIGWMRG